MGLNIRKRFLITETSICRCPKCQKIFDGNSNFCTLCGSKLKLEKTKIYANVGKNGISSYSYKLPNGTTINSKGCITMNLAKGISYTISK